MKTSHLQQFSVAMLSLMLISGSILAQVTTDWKYKIAITIDSTFIDDDLVNWTLVFDQSFSPVLTQVNGPLDADGTAASLLNGADIRFSTDAAGSNELAFDIRSWTTNNDPALGECEVAVKIPLVDDAAPTTIYMWWGNASASPYAVGDPFGQYNAYDAATRAVWIDGGKTERTSHQSNGTEFGGIVGGNVPGKVGSATSFNGTTQYFEVPNSGNFDFPNGQRITYFAVVKTPGGTGATNALIDTRKENDNGKGLGFTINSAGRCGFYIRDELNNITNWGATISINDNAWHTIGGTYEDNEEGRTFIDGVQNNLQVIAEITSKFSDATCTIGNKNLNGSVWSNFVGTLDEFRISQARRSEAWFKADHHNVMNTAGFLTFSSAPDNSFTLSDPNVCDGNDATISMSGSEVGVTYQLRLNSTNAPVGLPLAGTNGVLDFVVPSPTVSADYNVLASDDATGSSSVLTDLSSVTVNAVPAINATANIPPLVCGGTGNILFDFSNVPDGPQTIDYDGGSFPNVMVVSSQALVAAPAGAYNNLTITINGCTSIGDHDQIFSDPGTPVIAFGAIVNPTTCSGNDGSFQITGLTPNTTYTVNVTIGGVPSNANLASDASGIITWVNLSATTISNVSVTLTGCTSNTIGPITLADPPLPVVTFGGYQYTLPITIPAANVDGPDDLVDFPLLVSVDLDETHTTDPNGYDIIFTDANGAGLDFEVESYNSVNGQLLAWVRIPFLSASVDTEIKVLYGNPDISTDQSTPENVWSSNYSGVWHFENNFNDATIHGIDGTNNGTTDTPGQIGSAINYVTGQYIELPNNNPVGFNVDQFTFGAWVNVPNLSVLNVYLGIGNDGNDVVPNVFFANAISDGEIPISYVRDEVNIYGHLAANPISINDWHYIVSQVDFSAATDNISTYVDGIFAGATTLALSPDYSSGVPYERMKFGTDQLGTTVFFEGMGDEFRALRTALSAGWIKTEYDNQLDPTTFLSIGAETVNAQLPEVCINDAPIILEGGTPAGGVYSGTGVSLSGADYIFDPAISGTGTFTLTYTYTDANTCSNSATSDITVTAAPAAPSTTDIAACEGEFVPDLTATGSNVLWYSDAALINQVGAGNNFNPLQTAVGTYTYYATQSTNGGCESAATPTTLTIEDSPSITLGAADDILNTEASFDLPYTSTSGAPTTYSIVWSAEALAQGFVNVTDAALPASPITIPVPASVEGNLYSGTLTVGNTGACDSPDEPITIQIFNTILGVEEFTHMAVGLRKLSPEYSGFAIHARRADHNERNIGFDASGNLDVADLLAWAGGQTVYVTTLYNQNGDEANVLQVSPADQPMIVNNGVLITENGLPAIEFDGGGQFLTSAHIPPTDNFSVFTVAQTGTTHEIDPEGTTGVGGTSGQNYVLTANFGGADAGMGISVGTNGISNYEHGAGYMPATAVYSGANTGLNSIGVVYNAKQPSIYRNNSLLRTGLTSPRTQVFAPTTIGNSVYGDYNGKISEVIIFSTNLNANTVESIQCDQADYFDISNGCPIYWTGSEYLYGTGTNSAPGTGDGTRDFVVKGSGAILPGDARVNQMTVETGQDITVPAGISISVVDAINNEGTVSVESTGSIVQESVADNNTGAGIYHIERDDIRPNLEFQGWSSPIQSAQLMGPGGVFDGSNPCRTMVWNASSQRWKYDYVPGSVYNCGGGNITFTPRFLMFDDPADNLMDPARGYFIPGQNGSPTLTFSGQINNGTLIKPVFETNSTSPYTGDDWNLLGNPYPSALSIPLWLTANSAALSTVAVYLWDDDGSGGVDYDEFDDYAVINLFGFAGGEDGNGTHPVAPVGIATGQGFFVEASAIGNVSFTNAMRITGNNDKFYKTQPDDNPKLWINLNNQEGLQRQTLIGFASDATFQKDEKYDAPVLNANGILSIGTMLESTPMAIQAQPFLVEGDERFIPLHVLSKDGGKAILSFIRNEAMDGIEVYLKVPNQLAEIFIDDSEIDLDLNKGINDGYALIFRKGNVLSNSSINKNFGWEPIYTYDELMVEIIGSMEPDTRIEVLDLKGVVHETVNVTDRVTRINTQNWAAGMYLVHLKSGSRDEVKRVVIR
jgi:hypothetical protein